jgi:type IV pilus assembly protein PilB
MGIAPYMVAEATSLVVAQRLIRKVCDKCAVEHRVPEETLLEIGVPQDDLRNFENLRKGEGCDNCKGTGLKGRIAIFEVMRITGAVKDAIFRGASPLELKRYAIEKEGMKSLRYSAILKLKAGLTTVEEVLNTSVADDI